MTCKAFGPAALRLTIGSCTELLGSPRIGKYKLFSAGIIIDACIHALKCNYFNRTPSFFPLVNSTAFSRACWMASMVRGMRLKRLGG
jgi:hypothetical protein